MSFLSDYLSTCPSVGEKRDASPPAEFVVRTHDASGKRRLASPRPCAWCSQWFQPPKEKLVANKGRFCSPACGQKGSGEKRRLPVVPISELGILGSVLRTHQKRAVSPRRAETPNYTASELASESWRKVPGIDTHYEVSNLGRLRSCCPRRGFPVGQWNLISTNVGYPYVRFHTKSGGLRTVHYVHDWVARAFIGDRPTGLCVNHIDGNKANNRAANLEYLSQQQNLIHAVATGLITTGQEHASSRLTEEAVYAIRADVRSCKQIARSLGVSEAAVRRIRTRESWSSLPARPDDRTAQWMAGFLQRRCDAGKPFNPVRPTPPLSWVPSPTGDGKRAEVAAPADRGHS